MSAVSIRLVLTLSLAFAHFCAVDLDAAWRGDSEANLITLHGDHGNFDIITDADF